MKGAEVDFDGFAREQSPSLGRFAPALTGDPRLAQDLVQDTLVRAYTRMSRVAGADVRRGELFHGGRLRGSPMTTRIFGGNHIQHVRRIRDDVWGIRRSRPVPRRSSRRPGHRPP